jgi:hypothetical protein
VCVVVSSRSDGSLTYFAANRIVGFSAACLMVSGSVWRYDARKHGWLVHEQADLYAGEPVCVVHRALSKVFQDPLKARAEAVKDALNSIEQGVG